jgi:hypothetical protein
MASKYGTYLLIGVVICVAIYVGVKILLKKRK